MFRSVLAALLLSAAISSAPALAAGEKHLVCRAGGPLLASLDPGDGQRRPLLILQVAGEPYDSLERLARGHCLVDGFGLEASEPRRILLQAEGPVLVPPTSPGGLDAEVARDAAFQALLRLLEGGEGWFAAVAVEEAGAWRARRAFPCERHGCE